MSNYCKNCYELQEQLDQLKEQLNAYKMETEEGKEINAELKAENDLFRTCHDNEQAKRRKLEQTLTEIKEIAEDINDECEYLLFGSCAAEAKNQILQKISECEVGDKIKTVDLGFWDKNGEYKEDIQTVDITKE